MARERLASIAGHLHTDRYDSSLSIRHGDDSPALLHQTLPQHLRTQALLFPDRPMLISAWQDIRLTYRQLDELSGYLSNGLVQHGVRSGDRIA
jgi:non-ribosomal peptide synthetase component F